MIKFWKFFEYAYLVVSIIFIVEGILKWSSNRQNAYILFGFAILAVFMFFFRKHYRKKFERDRQS